MVCAENNSVDVAAAMQAVGKVDGDGTSLEAGRVAVSHGSAWDIASLLSMGRGFTVACLDLTTCGHMLVADHKAHKLFGDIVEE